MTTVFEETQLRSMEYIDDEVIKLRGYRSHSPMNTSDVSLEERIEIVFDQNSHTVSNARENPEDFQNLVENVYYDGYLAVWPTHIIGVAVNNALYKLGPTTFSDF